MAIKGMKKFFNRDCHYVHNSAHFHEDDCKGCRHFVDCLKSTDGFSSECICWKCYWHGTWDECGVRIIHMTRVDPEERYATCPMCGSDVEEID